MGCVWNQIQPDFAATTLAAEIDYLMALKGATLDGGNGLKYPIAPFGKNTAKLTR